VVQFCEHESSLLALTGFLISLDLKDVYTYNFPGDKRLIKLLGKRIHQSYELLPDERFTVYSIFLLETLQTALSGADLYYWFVSGYGNLNHLASPYFVAYDTAIMGSVFSLCVQLFFVYRIWVLGKRKTWWLCILISVVNLTLALVWVLEPSHNPGSVPLSAQQRRSRGLSM
jgi:hypothetical protein